MGYGRRNILASAHPRALSPDGNYYFTKGSLAGKVSHFCKWTNQKLMSNAGNSEIYHALRLKAADYLRETV